MRRSYWLPLLLAAIIIVGGVGTAHADGARNRLIADRMTPAVNRPLVCWTFVVEIRRQQHDLSSCSTGTGWFVTPDGAMLTNAHVVDVVGKGTEEAQLSVFIPWAVKAAGIQTDAELNALLAETRVVKWEITDFLVVMPWGEAFPAEILAMGSPVGEGESDDVAVLRLLPNNQRKPGNFITLDIGPAGDLRKGQEIFLLGYPGVADHSLLDNEVGVQLEATFTVGNISATDKTVRGRITPQLNVEANHGNSGGPVVDKDVISRGLLTFGDGGGDTHTNFAMSGELAMDFLNAARVKPFKGQATEVYEQMLAAFYANDLEATRAKLRELFAIAPELEQLNNIQKIIADVNAGRGGDDGSLSGGGGTTVVVRETDSSTGLIIGGVALLGVVLLGVVVVRIRNKKEDPTKPIPEAGIIVFMAGPMAGRQTPLGKSIVVGRDPARARVVINDPQVSGAHCVLEYTPGGVMLKDLASTNGTFVNGNRVEEKLLKHGDVIMLGSSEYSSFIYQGGVRSQAGATSVLNPAMLPGGRPAGGAPSQAAAPSPLAHTAPTIRFDSGPLAGQSFPVTQAVVIGRDPGRAHIVVSHPTVSGSHCELHPTPQGMLLVDRGSTNGTYLAHTGSAGRVVSQILQPAQQVVLGTGNEVTFTFVG